MRNAFLPVKLSIAVAAAVGAAYVIRESFAPFAKIIAALAGPA